MQNTLYQWLLAVCLLFLPINSEANIDSETAVSMPSANSVFNQTSRHFPKENSTEHLGFFKKWAKFFEKTQNTEGASDAEKSLKQARLKRILSIAVPIILGIVLIYFLQGSIWLTIVSVGIWAYWRNRKKITIWEKERYERIENPKPVEKKETEKETTKPLKVPLSDASNKWTRRAVNRFLYGLISVSGGGLFVALGSLSGGTLTLGILALILGSVLLLISILNAAQAIQNQEPRKKTAKAILVIGILLLLRYGLVLLAM
jgi:hypothetical protein